MRTPTAPLLTALMALTACTVELPEASPPTAVPRIGPGPVTVLPDEPVDSPLVYADTPEVLAECDRAPHADGVVEGCVGECAWLRSTVVGAELEGDPYLDFSIETEFDDVGRPVANRLVAVLDDGVLDVRNGPRAGGFLLLPTDRGAMYCVGAVRLRAGERGWHFELTGLRRLSGR